MDSITLIKNRQSGLYKHGKPKYQGPIEYKGEKIAQWHNPKNLIKDILGEAKTKRFVSLLLVGTPGTGKTTLATFIAHEIHLRENYLVYHIGKRELLEFENFINSLPNENVVLIFDDVSMIFKLIKDPNRKALILSTLTEVRHPKFESSDRRVIILANVHYLYAMEKMWRSQGSWKIYTDMSQEEADNFNHFSHNRYKHKVETFASIVTSMFRTEKFELTISKKMPPKEYTIDKPFRFIMCYDGSRLRFFVVPEEFCNYCDEKQNRRVKEKATPEEIYKLNKKYYDDAGILGLKLATLTLGETRQFRNKVIYAFNTAKDMLMNLDCDPGELSSYLRKNAQIPGDGLYTIRKKKTDYIKDLHALRDSESVHTFARDIIKFKEKDDKPQKDEEF